MVDWRVVDIFISYSREDRSRIQKVADCLEKEGFRVWWDNNLAGGAEFSRETEEKLNAARIVLVAWSKHSIGSHWVADEATVGRDRGVLIPIAIDDVQPKIGFRQFQTIDFHHWTGDASAREFAALVAALNARLSGAPPPPHAAKTGLFAGRLNSRASLATGVAVAVVAIAVFALSQRQTAERTSVATPPDQAVAEGSALDAVARRAIAEAGNSALAENEAAAQSFAAGDQKTALSILEKLAADLEAAGERDAAAAAYSRAAAVALLVDQGRGLAARRKALALMPQSMTAFQGLFFDTFLLQGAAAALRLADEAEARPDTSSDMRGFIYAHRAIVASDGVADFEEASRQIDRIKALRATNDSLVLEAAELWGKSVLAFANDDPDATIEFSLQGQALEPALPDDYPKNYIVGLVRGRNAQGDWEKAFAEGVESLDARRKAGKFIPTPLLSSVCKAGLYLGRARATYPYCEPLMLQKSVSGDYLNKVYSALYAAVSGDHGEARAELDAARALQPSDLRADAKSDLDMAEAFIAGAQGDIDAASEKLTQYAEQVTADPLTYQTRRSRIATANRLLGMHAINAKKPLRACEPLERARALYIEIGGDIGATKCDELLKAAGCID